MTHDVFKDHVADKLKYFDRLRSLKIQVNTESTTGRYFNLEQIKDIKALGATSPALHEGYLLKYWHRLRDLVDPSAFEFTFTSAILKDGFATTSSEFKKLQYYICYVTGQGW